MMPEATSPKQGAACTDGLAQAILSTSSALEASAVATGRGIKVSQQQATVYRAVKLLRVQRVLSSARCHDG